MSIRLSKEYGVNPSVDVCFWCGKDKGVVLFGSGYRGPKGEKAAPCSVMLDYEPCYACAAGWKLGVVLYEANEDGDTKKFYGGYPTGRYWVIKEEAIQRMFEQEFADAACKHRAALITPETATLLGLYDL